MPCGIQEDSTSGMTGHGCHEHAHIRGSSIALNEHLLLPEGLGQLDKVLRPCFRGIATQAAGYVSHFFSCSTSARITARCNPCCCLRVR